jgi:hypothetical protein
MTAKSKAEARSDLHIWDYSQMITLFVTVQNCAVTIIMVSVPSAGKVGLPGAW